MNKKIEKCLSLAFCPRATEHEAMNAFLAARRLSFSESTPIFSIDNKDDQDTIVFEDIPSGRLLYIIRAVHNIADKYNCKISMTVPEFTGAYIRSLYITLYGNRKSLNKIIAWSLKISKTV